MLTLLGGGEATRGDLDRALARAPLLVCADGGVNHALDWGLTPAAVIGDGDSMNPAAVAAAGVPVIEAPDQNWPDVDKALQMLGRQLVLAVGFLGGRLDHHLAALNALSRAPGRVIAIGSQDVATIIPRRVRLDLPQDTRVSLWPLAPSQGNSTGLRWPIDGLTLDPRGRLGTSNAATGGPVEVTVSDGELLLILPADHLDDLITAINA